MSTNVVTTREQSIAPSSGSVTVTVYGIRSPHAKKSPSTGVLMTIVGAVLPTTIVVVLRSDLPAESTTRRMAV